MPSQRTQISSAAGRSEHLSNDVPFGMWGGSATHDIGAIITSDEVLSIEKHSHGVAIAVALPSRKARLGRWLPWSMLD